MYQVGDIVRIREDLVDNRTYRTGDYCPSFNPNMGEYRGKFLTIEVINKKRDNYIVYTMKGCPYWSWSEAMFEPLTNDD